MNRQDLAELYQLLRMYGHVYPCTGDPGMQHLLSEIRKTYASQYNGGHIDDMHNPRGAGRKRIYTDEQNKEILRLRSDEMSLRAISKAAGCSLGHVQDVLRDCETVYLN